MELQMPYDETLGGEVTKVEECFEMVEYITEAQKGNLCSQATASLKSWFQDSSRFAEKVSYIDLGEFSFRLSYWKDSPLGSDKIDFPSHLFCYPEPGIEYFRPNNQILRYTGFSSLVILEPVNHFPLNPHSRECKQKNTFKPEITKILIDIGKAVLFKLGAKNVPILTPADAKNIPQFKGVVLLSPENQKESATLQEDACYQLVLNEMPSADLISLKTLKGIREYCSNLTQRQFGDFTANSTFSLNASFSAEYQYLINFGDDLNWTDVKRPSSETKTYRIPIKESLGFKSFEFGLGGFIPANSPSFPEPARPFVPPSPAWGTLLDPIKRIEISAIFPTRVIPEREPSLYTAPLLFVGAAFNYSPPEGAILAQILQNAIKFCFDEDYNCVFSFESESSTRSNAELFSRPYGTHGNREKGRDCVEIIEHLFSSNATSQLDANVESRLGAGAAMHSSVPYQSLLWQLTHYCISAASLENQVELRSFLEPLWKRFTAKIRQSWENNTLIPNVNPPTCSNGKFEVDLRFNLLHQKLSMINYCTERRQLAPKKSPSSNASSSGGPVKPIESYGLAGSPELLSPPASFPSIRTDSDSRRLPRPARENSLASESFVQLVCPSSTDSYASLAGIPQLPSSSLGRLSVLDDCRLLFHDEPLYIPVTQDPGFMTEDMLKEQALLFEQLGTSAQATQRRAQIQGAHLLSDMEAFKAANPRAALGDFVRWYSPRDWVAVPDNPQGALSARMGNPDNIWQELWQKAEPVPAYRQKQLFSPDTEGEKALHYLEHLTVFELLRLLLPTVFLVACDILVEALPHADLPLAHTHLKTLATQLALHPWNDPEPSILLDKFNETELFVEKILSLLKKLPDQYRLVSEIMDKVHPVAVCGKAERAALLALLDSQSKSMYPSMRSNHQGLIEPSNITYPELSPSRREMVFEGKHLSPSSSHCHRVYLEIASTGASICSLHPV
ncbi:hypothetical protein DSO57_1027263 [Entomophthora muscae]|uniref:Uncharacterized protein n=1 Tax=Entomophthora muscae TaxID=34485 RepID=A0ACC2U0L5_9FUNG|nr:hypothetical protein DSO57_1027263 [Entomophthora muscae]